MRHLYIVVISGCLMVLCACRGQLSDGSSPLPGELLASDSEIILEIPRETTPEPSPTPVVCTLLPERMRLQIVPESETVFTLELAGFEPGESLIFIFVGEKEDQSVTFESRPVAQVGKDGRFTSYSFNLGDYAPVMEFQGKIIHARGVACFDVALPLTP